MTDQAPVSSRHVRIKLHNLAFIPEAVIERMEIWTEITKNDRALTTVRMPAHPDRQTWDYWYREIVRALCYLEGADSGTPFAGVSQTFAVEWAGICRPI